ncbi:hypothetical protein NKDENANG_03933 [Candidatus Entotheonellaceae bacterium PAL068K]
MAECCAIVAQQISNTRMAASLVMHRWARSSHQWEG